MFHLDTMEDVFREILKYSPSAVRMMDLESYKASLSEEEIDNGTILEKAILYLIQDLYEIGIEFHCPVEDLTVDKSNIIHILQLLPYITPAALYQKLAIKPELRQVLQGILQGDISNDPLVIAWINYLGLDDEPYDEELYHAAEFAIGRITSTSQYNTVVENILELDGLKQSFSLNIDGDIDTRYLAYLGELETRFGEGLAILKKYTRDESVLTAIEKYHRTYRRSLERSDRFNEYAVMFVGGSPDGEDPNFLPFARKLQEHAVSSPFYLDYYKARKIKPTVSHYWMMILQVYASSNVEDNYTDRMRALRDSVESLPSQYMIPNMSNVWPFANVLLTQGSFVS